jgi:hypothetical protein
LLSDALLALENIRRSGSFAKTLINKQPPPPPPPPLSVNTIEIMSEGVFGTSPGEEDKHEIVLKEEEEPPPAGPDNCCNRSAEPEFVRELLVASGLTKSYDDDDDADIFEDLERYNEDSRKRSRKSGQLQHCLLLDTMNEILARKRELENSYSRVYVPTSQKKKNLVEEVWEQMQGMIMTRATTCAADDVCDTVQRILERDLLESKSTNAVAPQAESWAHDYRLELSKLEVGLEQMIFKDLMDEAVEELKTCFGNSSSSSSKNCCSCCCCCCCCLCCQQQQQQHQHHPPRLRSSASCSRNSLQFPKKATARRQLLFMH